MRSLPAHKLSSGQTALEYLLLMAIVAAVVLSSLKFLLPKIHDASEGYYNQVTRVIMGEDPKPTPGGWCPVTCPPPGTPDHPSCGASVIRGACECPSPAFGAKQNTPDSCPAGLVTCTGAQLCQEDGQGHCHPLNKPCLGEIVQCFGVQPTGTQPCGQCEPQKDSKGNNTCFAPAPACGQTTQGVDSCNNYCQKKSPACVACAPPQPQGDVCKGVDNNDASGAPWTVVAACTGAKCEVQCASGNEPDPKKDACVSYYCKGTPPDSASHTKVCEGQDTGLTRSDISYTFVAACHSGAKCQVTCDDQSYFGGTGCVPTGCQGNKPGGQECANTQVHVPPGTSWRPVASCSGAKCEVQCVNGQIPDLTASPLACRAPKCTGTIDKADDGSPVAATCAPAVGNDAPMVFVDRCATPPVPCTVACNANAGYVRSGSSCTLCGNGRCDAGESCGTCVGANGQPDCGACGPSTTDVSCSNDGCDTQYCTVTYKVPTGCHADKVTFKATHTLHYFNGLTLNKNGTTVFVADVPYDSSMGEEGGYIRAEWGGQVRPFTYTDTTGASPGTTYEYIIGVFHGTGDRCVSHTDVGVHVEANCN